jgi:hypothetical protein
VTFTSPPPSAHSTLTPTKPHESHSHKVERRVSTQLVDCSSQEARIVTTVQQLLHRQMPHAWISLGEPRPVGNEGSEGDAQLGYSSHWPLHQCKSHMGCVVGVAYTPPFLYARQRIQNTITRFTPLSRNRDVTSSSA